jgi:hypothetical protein
MFAHRPHTEINVYINFKTYNLSRTELQNHKEYVYIKFQDMLKQTATYFYKKFEDTRTPRERTAKAHTP